MLFYVDKIYLFYKQKGIERNFLELNFEIKLFLLIVQLFVLIITPAGKSQGSILMYDCIPFYIGKCVTCVIIRIKSSELSRFVE